MNRRIASVLLAALEQVARRRGVGGADGALRLARGFGIDGYLMRWAQPSQEPDRALQVYRRLQARLLQDAAMEVHEALDAAHVPHFFYKGVALLGTRYQPGDRDAVDIDFHVHPEVRAEGLRAVKRLGYREESDRDQPGPASLRAATMLSRATGASDLESVSLDMHWAVEPLERLLPRSELLLPTAVWRSLNRDGELPVPCDEHHLVLLAHHLVHHDLLHVKGLLDFVLTWAELSDAGGPAALELATVTGALRATRLFGALAHAEFDLPGPHGLALPAARLPDELRLDRWLEMASAASEAQHQRITPQRVRRRLMFLDRRGDAGKLLADAVFPPRAFLEWRWSRSRSPLAAWLRHLAHLVGKLRRT